MENSSFLIISTIWQFLLMEIVILAIQFWFYKSHKTFGMAGLIVMVFILVAGSLLIRDIDFFKIHLILQFPLFVVILTKIEDRLRMNDSVPREKRDNERELSGADN